MLPAAIGAGAAQINLLVGTMLASLLGTGAISHLYYAERITWLPIGIIGVAVATALLPRMSRLLGAGEDKTAIDNQNRGIELVLLLGLPAAAALIVMPLPIVQVLFVRGAYTLADAEASSAALAAFACGVPAYLLVRVLTPGFFARHDTKTPVKVAFVAVAVNVAASLALMWVLGIVGIALANVLAAWTAAVLQAAILFRRGHLAFDDRLRRRIPRIALASAAMAAVLWLAAPYAASFLTGPLLIKIAALAALVVGGGAVYGVAVLALRAATLADVRSALRRGP
jgi:putative peptidoglycan lipid II flippase